MTAGLVEEYVEADDGARLWTATSGNGPPLVLCHGGPGLWDYLGLVAALVDDLVTVHRWDQRGCGRSTGSGPYTVERFVEDLEEIRTHFGHDRWMVGGHSWGATLALHHTFAHPRRVTALLYVSGTGVGRAWNRAYHEEADRRLTAEQRRRRDELKAKERDGAEEREWRILNDAPDFADRDRALKLAEAQHASDLRPINHACNAVLNAETKTWHEEDLLARCRNLDVPVLVVDGAEDPRPTWALDSMVEALPNVERRTIPDAGHMPWVEDPDTFASALREFLGRETQTDDMERKNLG